MFSYQNISGIKGKGRINPCKYCMAFLDNSIKAELRFLRYLWISAISHVTFWSLLKIMNVCRFFDLEKFNLQGQRNHLRKPEKNIDFYDLLFIDFVIVWVYFKHMSNPQLINWNKPFWTWQQILWPLICHVVVVFGMPIEKKSLEIEFL